MKKTYFLFLLLILCLRFSASGQVNLVPNGGFEIIDSCPSFGNKLYWANPWFQPCFFQGNLKNSSSTDLYNICGVGDMAVPFNQGGYQQAKSGGGYAGFLGYYAC